MDWAFEQECRGEGSEPCVSHCDGSKPEGLRLHRVPLFGLIGKSIINTFAGYAIFFAIDAGVVG